MNQIFNPQISDRGARIHPTFGIDVRDCRPTPLVITVHNPKVGQFGNTRTYEDGRPRFHGGIDISGSVGDLIYAAHAGIIQRAGYQISPGPEGAGFGLRVYIKNDDVITVYAHLSGIIVRTGHRVVIPGEVIGFMGESGNKDRKGIIHIHFETRVYIKAQDKFVRIDPELWLDWKEAA